MGIKSFWNVVRKDKNWAQLKREDSDIACGTYKLCDRSNIDSNDKLAENIVKAYNEYYRESRKKKILEPVIMENRTVVIYDKINAIPIAEFRLKKQENIIKDFGLASRMTGIFEEYYKNMSVDYDRL